MGQKNGAELCRDLRTNYRESIVIIGMSSEPLSQTYFLKANADHFFYKSNMYVGDCLDHKIQELLDQKGGIAE